MIASGDNQDHPATSITNAVFFDETIDYVKYREQSRIDRTASDDQAKAALNSAIVDINHQLIEWIEAKKNEGYNLIDNVPSPMHLPEKYFIDRYRRAVYCMADALLAENYRDFDSTAEGHQRADSMTDRIDDYRRESIYAVADILGTHRRRIELL